MKGDFAGSTALGLGVADIPPKSEGCVVFDAAPNVKAGLGASTAGALFSAAVSAFGGAPNENGNGLGVVAGASGALGAPKVNGELGASDFSDGLPKENADTATGAEAAGRSDAGSAADAGAGFGTGENGLANAETSGVLLVSATLCSSPDPVFVFPKRDFSVESLSLGIGEVPNKDGVSLAAVVVEEVEGGRPKEKLLGSETCVDFDNAAEFAKKFGTDEEPLPVTLASSCSKADCFGAEESTAGPGLGGIRAICGTALIKGVRGAGADTACDSAATVIGGEGWTEFVGSLKPLGKMSDFSDSLPLSVSFAASLVFDEPKVLVMGVGAEADLIRENGKDAIGGSFAFVASC